VSDNLPAVVLVRPLHWGVPPMSEGDFLLPTGTVTLLLADVEGSTRQWENDPDATQTAIVRLNAIVDDAVGRHDGVRPVEQGEGDSFVAAFARARDALLCALAIQQALVREPLALRIGIHTGDVQRRDEGNYVGQTINRAARLRDVAHGGQTVLSQAAHDLVVDGLPDGASLRDLGTHRLRDLARPEHIFQLCHPDLGAEFPALRSLNAMPHNLPAQRTSFVGRTAEVAEVKWLLAETTVLTITGAGGCGKTRLALQVGADLLDAHPDGVWLVELAPVADSDAVPAQAALVFAVKEGPGMSPTDAVAAYLGKKDAVLILDNCEHVIDGAAALADAVLSRCPGVTILATSRQPLGVPGEVTWRVPSMAVPDEDRPAGIGAVSACEAVQLFAERARRARPGFEIGEDNAAAVAQICRDLDGIPLAIELAAARARVFAPAQIAEGLSERFRLLTGGTRTALARQQTLEASVDWSHDLLTDVERIVFRRLSVFAGSFSFEAAEDVGAGGVIERHQVLDLLSLLVDKSLVVVDDDGDRARYRLLETIRYYAAGRLGEAGEEVETRTRHRDHYLAFAEEAEAHLEGRGQVEWMGRVARDYPNLRAALAWSQDRADGEPLVRIAAALHLFWETRGPAAEGEQWLDAALAHDAVSPALRAKALFGRSYLAFVNVDLGTAIACAEEGLGLARHVGDDRLTGRLLCSLGTAFIWTGGDPVPALEEAVALARRADDTFMLAEGLSAHGGVHINRVAGRARPYLQESIRVAEDAGNRVTTDFSLALLGVVSAYEGDLGDARSILERVLERSNEVLYGMAVTLAAGVLATVLVDMAEHAEALAAADRLEATALETGAHAWDLFAPLARGLVSAAEGDHAPALHLFGEALTLPSLPELRARMVAAIADTELAVGMVDDARAHADEVIEVSRSTDFPVGSAQGLVLQARLRRMERELVDAEDVAHEALTAAVDIAAKASVVDALEVLAGIAADFQSHQEAARLFGAAEAIRDRTGYVRHSFERDGDIAATGQALGPVAFEKASEEGQGLSLDDAVAYARRGRGERKRPSTGWPSLSPSETQVVALVREGLTNSGIAERLFISPRTVQSHLTHIFTKLGVSTRTELAVIATRRQ
jgi:predicted ATPase/class 3 adenylate cyclase/DNA-binding CsgD family transcriptional regulator